MVTNHLITSHTGEYYMVTNYLIISGTGEYYMVTMNS